MTVIVRILAATFGLAASISSAPAQETMRVAIGGFGLWAVEAPRLGQQAGIFKKHGLNVEY
jgi:ABC-type nitrate/sulfonate/bicarbonate transport system substrate-binding protein